ncbi:MAG: ATPase, T2SS/T4P/T4SS family [Deltaproteobacteria bacterium]|nr:ATPase, T2SS/T4P/T4SS family [Deltaproteobacteria bacterium]
MNPRVIAIVGVKDRVGASTFALELATALHKRKESVLFLDWDAEHPGDLSATAKSAPWRCLNDLSRLPKPLEAGFLNGFLKRDLGFAVLSLCLNKNQLSSIDPQMALHQLQTIFDSFDWVIADLGSRWNPFANCFLKISGRLVLVMQASANLLNEAKRKLDELATAYFPKKRIGWVGWHWDKNSFLNMPSTADFLQIPSLGDSPESCLAHWTEAFLSDADLEAFLPDLLPPLSGVGLQSHEKQERVAELLPSLDEAPDLKIRLLKWIQEKMELKGLKTETGEEGLRMKVQKIVLEVLEENSFHLPPTTDRTALAEELLDELLGLGPLEILLKRQEFGEILVNGTGPIFVEESGRLKSTPFRFISRASLDKAIERILLPVGRRIDEAQPMVDARLACGSRVNIIAPPLALEGPVISIRRFSKRVLTPEDLVQLGTFDQKMCAFLETAVKEKLNILVSGGTGSGKTTLLNILSSFIPAEERIITIEDAAELFLNQPHVVRLESRPANIEGKGAVTIRDLVRNALRMRPDRIIVGECRGAESLDMLQAMNTGHDGSLTTLHANSPRDALARLETLVMFAGIDLPSRAIREQICGAIDIVVQITRLKTGERKVLSIMKLSGMEGDVFTLEEIYDGAS